MLTGALSVLERGIDSTTVDLLCFDIGKERFAVELSFVDEVIDAAVLDAHAVHGSMIGVIRLRDDLIPVHDAECVLYVARKSPEPMALVFTAHGAPMAMLVDYAEAALAIDMDALRSPGAVVARDSVMLGALKVGSRWVGLLDAESLVDAFGKVALSEESHAH
ncbi:MAG: chemotaxis protein CheW [Gemmatimonadaceae bacterium]